MPQPALQTDDTFTFPGTQMTVNRMGYGAMRLSGPQIWGPPADREQALAVLREAVAAGVDHIDTSDFYGPHVTNQIIREALHPYPAGLVIVTKVGARREDGKWLVALEPEELVSAVHDNLRNLGLERLDIVNLRVGSPLTEPDTPIEPQMIALLRLQEQGLISHIGLSNVTPKQLEEGLRLGEIVCVQNLYNVANRTDDAMIDQLAARDIAYVPYFPLGGFTPLQSGALDTVAAELGATPLQTALAWLLHRSPNVLLIPGTSSVAHLRENLAAQSFTLTPRMLEELDGIAALTQPEAGH